MGWVRRSFRVRGSASFGALVAIAASAVPVFADAPAPEVEVRALGPQPIAGTLVELSLDDAIKVRMDGAPLREIPSDEIVRIATSATPASSGESLDTIWFASGQRVGGRFLGAEDERIVFEAEDVGVIRVPIGAMIRWTTARAGVDANRAARGGEAPPEDRVRLTNGDVIRGFISTIDGERLSVAGEVLDHEIPLELLAEVRFARAGASAPAGRHAIVDLRHGARLTVPAIAWRDGTFVAELPDVGEVTIQAGDVLRMELIGGRWEWLSRHAPVTYQHTPMLSLDWPYRTDENLFGDPLSVAGRRFERGISVHSRSSLTYELGGQYREFVTAFGLDDSSGPLADVDVRVRVDGQTRYEKAHVRRGELVGPIRLELTGAGRIELIVDFGAGGDLQDRFDWIEPALIR